MLSDSQPSAGFGPVFRGRFSDGRAPLSSDVDVRLAETGIEIMAPGARAVLLWPYGGLTVSAPLGPHATDVLISYRYADTASLFVAEGAFARRLRELAPHLSTRAARWRDVAPWLWAATAVAAVAGLVSLANLSPARGIARLIPDGTRTALGEQVVGSMTKGRKVCEDASGRAALDRLVARLVAASGSKKPFSVVVVDWGLVNAFAAPGERIVLTRGLIDKAAGPDEVAGVLAHEMGHGLELHPESGIVRALGLAAATDLLLGGSGGTLANVGVLLAQLSYTRDAEREADRHAIRILREGAISAQGLADFFRRIDTEEEGGGKSARDDKTRDDKTRDDKTRDGKTRDGKTPAKDDKMRRSGGTFDLLRTHPQSAERARIVAEAPRYAATPALDGAGWNALRGICSGPARKL
jgi:Zn-dependent protease with chaperone function